jgi:hypothetical protein
VQVETMDAMAQRHQRAAILEQREAAKIARHPPGAHRAGSRHISMQSRRFDVDPVNRPLLRHPGGGFADRRVSIEHSLRHRHVISPGSKTTPPAPKSNAAGCNQFILEP